MFRSFGFVFALAVVSVSAQEELQCQKITTDTSLNFMEKEQYAYCKIAETDKDNFCLVEFIPAEDKKGIINKITYLDNAEQQKIVSYTMEEQEKKGFFSYPGEDMYISVAGVSDDKECVAFLKCPTGKPAVMLYLCKKAESCEDAKYIRWLSDIVKNIEGVVPVEKMKKQYQFCHSKGVF